MDPVSLFFMPRLPNGQHRILSGLAQKLEHLNLDPVWGRRHTPQQKWIRFFFRGQKCLKTKTRLIIHCVFKILVMKCAIIFPDPDSVVGNTTTLMDPDPEK